MTLFVTMNQRDDHGTSTPGDWLAVVQDGDSWKFPTCYRQQTIACTGVPQPVAVLDTHATAASLVIVTGQLGTSVGTAALAAEWSKGKVLRVALEKADGGYRSKVTTLLEGVANPVALIVTKNNSLLVGDWTSEGSTR